MSLLSIIQQLSDYDTALVANTIGYLDPTPEQEWYMGGSIASITPALGPTVGQAVTIEVATSTPNNEWDFEPLYDQVKVMEKTSLPKVLVVKAVGSRPDHECVLGDGLAKMLYSVGCVGMVTDGGVRDVEALLGIPFAAYARGRTIHHCAWRFTKPGERTRGGRRHHGQSGRYHSRQYRRGDQRSRPLAWNNCRTAWRQCMLFRTPRPLCFSSVGNAG